MTNNEYRMMNNEYRMMNNELRMISDPGEIPYRGLRSRISQGTAGHPEI